MTDQPDFPKPKYNPLPRHTLGAANAKNRVLDVEAVRAHVGDVVLPTPKVTTTASVTVTGGASSDDSAVTNLILENGVALTQVLIGLAFSKDVKPETRQKIIFSLLDRGYGKPTQRVESLAQVTDLSTQHLEALRLLSKKG